jgi:hypothetical protein
MRYHQMECHYLKMTRQTKKFLLFTCYDTHHEPFEVSIIGAGTKQEIIQCILDEYGPYRNYARVSVEDRINTLRKNLFTEGNCEINAEITVYVEPYKEGYCVVTAGPGYGEDHNWYDSEEKAMSKFESVVTKLQQNTDNELNYSISVYKIENNNVIKLGSDMAPFS